MFWGGQRVGLGAGGKGVGGKAWTSGCGVWVDQRWPKEICWGCCSSPSGKEPSLTFPMVVQHQSQYLCWLQHRMACLFQRKSGLCCPQKIFGVIWCLAIYAKYYGIIYITMIKTQWYTSQWKSHGYAALRPGIVAIILTITPIMILSVGLVLFSFLL